MNQSINAAAAAAISMHCWSSHGKQENIIHAIAHVPYLVGPVQRPYRKRQRFSKQKQQHASVIANETPRLRASGVATFLISNGGGGERDEFVRGRLSATYIAETPAKDSEVLRLMIRAVAHNPACQRHQSALLPAAWFVARLTPPLLHQQPDGGVGGWGTRGVHTRVQMRIRRPFLCKHPTRLPAGCCDASRFNFALLFFHSGREGEIARSPEIKDQCLTSRSWRRAATSQNLASASPWL